MSTELKGLSKLGVLESMWEEVGFMVVLLVFSLFMLAVGGLASVMNDAGVASWATVQIRYDDANALQISGMERALYAVGVQQPDAQSYWLMHANSINGQRVVYQVLTKPGFRWLALYGLFTLIAVAVVLEMSWRAVLALYEAVLWLRSWLSDLIVRPAATLYGTVEITARQGVIYMSGVGRAVAEGMEELAVVISIRRMRVVGV